MSTGWWAVRVTSRRLSVAARSVIQDKVLAVSQRRLGLSVSPTTPMGVHMAPNDKSAGVKVGDRDKALETALAQIERQFGRGAVMRLGDDARAPVEVIPTGSISLDVALGIGGLPRGRIVEIYGPESSGKTSLALHAVANAQKSG